MSDNKQKYKGDSENNNSNKKSSNREGQKHQNKTKSNIASEEESQITEILDITTLAEYKSLVSELDQANQKIKESIELAKIYKSDMERIKERAKFDEAILEEKLTIELAKKLLIVQDNFEKSFEHINDENDLKGFKMIYQSLADVLESMGVVKIDVLGKEFDADSMNAIMSDKAKNNKDEGKVSRVFAEGYVYKPTDKIVRYAQVGIFVST